jgi:outer membrane immunogenic protein
MKNSKLILSAAVAVSAMLGIGAASAADLPVKASPYTAAAPASSWTGFYVGGTAGAGWGNEASNVAISTGLIQDFSPIVPGSYKKRMLGFAGGVEAGYNLQFNSLVLGVESDFSYANINGSANANETFFPPAGVTVLCPLGAICTTRTSYNEQQTLSWLATVRGRIGFLATPSWLIYGTGGWAVGNVKSSASAIFAGQTTLGGVTTTTSTPLIFSGSSSQIQNGWTLGGGTEYMLTRNWTGKVEYLYYDLGSVTLVGTTVGHSITTTSNMPVHGQIFRVGTNYKF